MNSNRAIGLTARARELLDFIEAHFREHRVAPSYDEMRVAVGLASKSGVARLVEQLSKRGHIRVMAGCARAIELCADDPVRSFTLPADLHIRLANDAARNGRSVEEHLAQAVREFLAATEPPEREPRFERLSA